MNRPRPDSQAGRILELFVRAHGAKVSLPEILNLRISQYSARIHDLRHKYGFVIENGCDPDHPGHTWFRLLGSAATTQPSSEPIPKPVVSDLLFPEDELERCSRWEDVG